jgi:transcriptional regulator with XRE-family HTH domain
MAEKDPRIIGERIARLRHQRDITQVELAEALGVSPSTVADWERGARYPRRKMGKVEQFFGQRVDYDEPGEGPRRPSPAAEEELEAALAEVDRLLRKRRNQETGKDGDGDARFAV